jgi:hypothetical protein
VKSCIKVLAVVQELRTDPKDKFMGKILRYDFCFLCNYIFYFFEDSYRIALLIG